MKLILEAKTNISRSFGVRDSLLVSLNNVLQLLLDVGFPFLYSQSLYNNCKCIQKLVFVSMQTPNRELTLLFRGKQNTLCSKISCKHMSEMQKQKKEGKGTL